MSLVEDDNAIWKFSAKASDYALNISILPRGSRRGDNLVYAQARQPSLYLITKYTIAILQQILWGRVERKRFYDLLGCPLRGRIFRHVETVQYVVVAPSTDTLTTDGAGQQIPAAVTASSRSHIAR